MFSTLLMFLEQAPTPAVTVQKITHGGGAEIERLTHHPRQQPALEFQLKQGFIITGTIIDRKLKAPITQLISIPLHVQGTITETKTVRVTVHGTIQGRLRLGFKTYGEITENPADLEREIADLKYLIAKKRQRRGD